jgi:hypothetical protein
MTVFLWLCNILWYVFQPFGHPVYQITKILLETFNTTLISVAQKDLILYNRNRIYKDTVHISDIGILKVNGNVIL